MSALKFPLILSLAFYFTSCLGPRRYVVWSPVARYCKADASVFFVKRESGVNHRSPLSHNNMMQEQSAKYYRIEYSHLNGLHPEIRRVPFGSLAEFERQASSINWTSFDFVEFQIFENLSEVLINGVSYSIIEPIGDIRTDNGVNIYSATANSIYYLIVETIDKGISKYSVILSDVWIAANRNLINNRLRVIYTFSSGTLDLWLPNLAVVIDITTGSYQAYPLRQISALDLEKSE